MLIAAILGIDARATMDMDATIKVFELNEDKLKNIFNEILSIPVDYGYFDFYIWSYLSDRVYYVRYG